MPRAYNFFSGTSIKEEEVDRTEENLFGSLIGGIGGAIFGAALGALTANPGLAAAGAITGAQTGAIAGAQPGLIQEASDYFMPPTTQTQAQSSVGKGLMLPSDPPIQQQPIMPIPVNYLDQMPGERELSQRYAPKYMSEMNRYV